MSEIKKIQDDIKYDYECSLYEDEYMTIDQFRTSINKPDLCNESIGKILRGLNYHSMMKKLNGINTRIYFIRRCDDAPEIIVINRKKIKQPGYLREIIMDNFRNDNYQFISSNEVFEFIQKRVPEYEFSKQLIGRLFKEMGFKSGQRRIDGKNNRVYYLKYALQHNQNFADLF